MTSSTGTWIYAVNLLIGGAGFALLVFGATRRWSEFPTAVKQLHALAIVLFAGLITVSAQQLYLGEGIVFDAFVVFGVKVTALVLMWKIRNTLYRTGDRHVAAEPGEKYVVNEDSDDPNKDIVAEGHDES